MKALALCLVAACATYQPVKPPQVVTVITPYVPVLALDPNETAFIGAVRCDLNGHPVIYVSTRLSAEQTYMVLFHERIHVAQALGYGSCPRFRDRYAQDSTFRLQVEGDAYCQTRLLQRKLGRPEDPTWPQIIDILMQKYEAEYTRDAVLAALPCG